MTAGIELSDLFLRFPAEKPDFIGHAQFGDQRCQPFPQLSVTHDVIADRRVSARGWKSERR